MKFDSDTHTSGRYDLPWSAECGGLCVAASVMWVILGQEASVVATVRVLSVLSVLSPLHFSYYTSGFPDNSASDPGLRIFPLHNIAF